MLIDSFNRYNDESRHDKSLQWTIEGLHVDFKVFFSTKARKFIVSNVAFEGLIRGFRPRWSQSWTQQIFDMNDRGSKRLFFPENFNTSNIFAPVWSLPLIQKHLYVSTRIITLETKRIMTYSTRNIWISHDCELIWKRAKRFLCRLNFNFQFIFWC